MSIRSLSMTLAGTLYLAKARKDYGSGARPGTGVAAMNEAAAALDDDKIDAVAHYLATLGPSQTQGHP